METAVGQMVEKVRKFIDRHKMLREGDGVVVGVSGGADSMCLLHLLYILKDEYRIRLQVVHVNHMLRGAAADEDEIFVRSWCERLQIAFHSVRYDVRDFARQKKMSVEEAGRELRYREFFNVLQQTGASKIAVAQNRNDQVETVLMRIFRGTGLDGITGIDPVRGAVIRPLLNTGRQEIEEYCQKNGIEPRIDHTNMEIIYTRNKIRLEWIPYIRDNFNANLEEVIVNMASNLREDKEYMLCSAVKAFEKCGAVLTDEESSVLLDCEGFLVLHPSIQKRVLRLAVEKVKGTAKGVENRHIEDMLSLIRLGKSGSSLHLPGGIRMKKTYGTARMFIQNMEKNMEKQSGQDFPHPCRRLIIPGKTPVPELELAVLTNLEDGSHPWGEKYFHEPPASTVQYFDYEKVTGGKKEVWIRNRRSGDLFSPMGMKGTKKLKEFFIDEKISRERRESVPLLAVDGEILWVVGYRASEKYKVGGGTRIVLKVEITKEQ